MFLCNDVRSNVCQRDALELRIDTNEINRAGFIRLDVTKIAVGFAADHIRQSRNERVHCAGDTSAASCLESFRDKTHGVRRVGETLELQIKLRFPAVVSLV